MFDWHMSNSTLLEHRRRKRGGGGGGGGGGRKAGRGRANIPNNPPAFSFNFYVKQEKITNVPS